MIKLPVTCLCPGCGEAIPITIIDAARVLRAGRKKELTTEQYSAAGKKGMSKRWEGHVKNIKK